MIMKSETNKTSAGWLPLLMAGSVASGLLLVPAVQAEDTAPSQATFSCAIRIHRQRRFTRLELR